MAFQENIIVGNDGKAINFIPSRAVAVTTNDTAILETGLLFVGVSGDVTATPSGQSTTVVFKNVPAGTFLPIYIKLVHTDTTATNLLICY